MLIYVIFTMVDVADFYKLNKSNGFRNLSPAIATAYHWVGCRTCTYPARGTRRQQPGGTPCMRPNAKPLLTQPPPPAVVCGAPAVQRGGGGGSWRELWSRRRRPAKEGVGAQHRHLSPLVLRTSYKNDGVCCTYLHACMPYYIIIYRGSRVGTQVHAG
jgi:hypothetical protein